MLGNIFTIYAVFSHVLADSGSPWPRRSRHYLSSRLDKILKIVYYFYWRTRAYYFKSMKGGYKMAFLHAGEAVGSGFLGFAEEVLWHGFVDTLKLNPSCF